MCTYCAYPRHPKGNVLQGTSKASNSISAIVTTIGTLKHVEHSEGQLATRNNNDTDEQLYRRLILLSSIQNFRTPNTKHGFCFHAYSTRLRASNHHCQKTRSQTSQAAFPGAHMEKNNRTHAEHERTHHGHPRRELLRHQLHCCHGCRRWRLHWFCARAVCPDSRLRGYLLMHLLWLVTTIF